MSENDLSFCVLRSVNFANVYYVCALSLLCFSQSVNDYVTLSHAQPLCSVQGSAQSNKMSHAQPLSNTMSHAQPLSNKMTHASPLSNKMSHAQPLSNKMSHAQPLSTRCHMPSHCQQDVTCLAIINKMSHAQPLSTRCHMPSHYVQFRVQLSQTRPHSTTARADSVAAKDVHPF